VEEEKVLVSDIELSAMRRTPLSHHQIEEYVNKLLEMKYGKNFQRCGQNWVDRFLEHHRDRLKTIWERPLNSVWAGCLNPESVHHWFHDVLWPNVQGVEPTDLQCVPHTHTRNRLLARLPAYTHRLVRVWLGVDSANFFAAASVRVPRVEDW
jgi:hypothetical protein